MEIITYTHAAEFIARTRPLLLENEAANNVMIGVSEGIIRNPTRYRFPPYLATIEDEHTLLAAALMTPPFNLVVNAFTPNFRPAFELIAQNMVENNWKARGVLGRAEQSALFAEVFSQASGLVYRTGLRERLYELREVIPPTAVSGNIMQATEADTELLVGWLSAFMEEALHGEDSTNILELAKMRIRNGDIYFWQDGQYVSLAAKTRPTVRGCAIGPVYTPPEFRGKGYASACTASLSQLILDSGKDFCTLFTDLSNPTSNSIYQKIGYKPLCDFDEYLFK
jgi:predicted GNAT family acetyltransferase